MVLASGARLGLLAAIVALPTACAVRDSFDDNHILSVIDEEGEQDVAGDGFVGDGAPSLLESHSASETGAAGRPVKEGDEGATIKVTETFKQFGEEYHKDEEGTIHKVITIHSGAVAAARINWTHTGKETMVTQLNLDKLTVIHEGPEPSASGTHVQGVKYRALFAFPGDSEAPAFNRGEVLYVTELLDGQWLYGRTEHGSPGYIPSNYVEKVVPKQEHDPMWDDLRKDLDEQATTERHGLVEDSEQSAPRTRLQVKAGDRDKAIKVVATFDSHRFGDEGTISKVIVNPRNESVIGANIVWTKAPEILLGKETMVLKGNFDKLAFIQEDSQGATGGTEPTPVQQITQLMNSLGCTKTQAVEALDANGGNIEMAADKILNDRDKLKQLQRGVRRTGSQELATAVAPAQQARAVPPLEQAQPPPLPSSPRPDWRPPQDERGGSETTTWCWWRSFKLPQAEEETSKYQAGLGRSGQEAAGLSKGHQVNRRPGWMLRPSPNNPDSKYVYYNPVQEYFEDRSLRPGTSTEFEIPSADALQHPENWGGELNRLTEQGHKDLTLNLQALHVALGDVEKAAKLLNGLAQLAVYGFKDEMAVARYLEVLNRYDGDADKAYLFLRPARPKAKSKATSPSSSGASQRTSQDLQFDFPLTVWDRAQPPGIAWSIDYDRNAVKVVSVGSAWGYITMANSLVDREDRDDPKKVKEGDFITAIIDNGGNPTEGADAIDRFLVHPTINEMLQIRILRPASQESAAARGRRQSGGRRERSRSRSSSQERSESPQQAAAQYKEFLAMVEKPPGGGQAGIEVEVDPLHPAWIKVTEIKEVGFIPDHNKKAVHHGGKGGVMNVLSENDFITGVQFGTSGHHRKRTGAGDIREAMFGDRSGMMTLWVSRLKTKERPGQSQQAAAQSPPRSPPRSQGATGGIGAVDGHDEDIENLIAVAGCDRERAAEALKQAGYNVDMAAEILLGEEDAEEEQNIEDHTRHGRDPQIRTQVHNAPHRPRDDQRYQSRTQVHSPRLGTEDASASASATGSLGSKPPVKRRTRVPTKDQQSNEMSTGPVSLPAHGVQHSLSPHMYQSLLPHMHGGHQQEPRGAMTAVHQPSSPELEQLRLRHRQIQDQSRAMTGVLDTLSNAEVERTRVVHHIKDQHSGRGGDPLNSLPPNGNGHSRLSKDRRAHTTMLGRVDQDGQFHGRQDAWKSSLAETRSDAFEGEGSDGAQEATPADPPADPQDSHAGE